MSLNVYEAEEVIHFGPEPSTFYGLHVSTSSTNESFCPFASAELRTRFVNRAEEIAPNGEGWELAGVALAAFTGSESQQDAFRELAAERWGERAYEMIDELEAAAEAMS